MIRPFHKTLESAMNLSTHFILWLLQVLMIEKMKEHSVLCHYLIHDSLTSHLNLHENVHWVVLLLFYICSNGCKKPLLAPYILQKECMFKGLVHLKHEKIRHHLLTLTVCFFLLWKTKRRNLKEMYRSLWSFQVQKSSEAI